MDNKRKFSKPVEEQVSKANRIFGPDRRSYQFLDAESTKMLFTVNTTQARIGWWLEHWTCDQKVASSDPGRSGGRIFFSRANFVCWLLFCDHSIAVLPQWHIKDPGHSAKSADGRLHLNMHTPMTQQSWSGLTMLLSRHSVGTYHETSSHTTHQETLGHSRLSSLSHCGLILA